MEMRRLLPLAFIIAFLGGCGGSSTTLPPGNVILSDAGAVEGPHTLARLEISFTIPQPRPESSKAHYISLDTKGMTFVFKGPSKINMTVSVLPKAPGCKPFRGVTRCGYKLQVRTGNYLATVSAYDEVPVNGKIPVSAHLLSTAVNVPFKVLPNVVNYGRFALDGIVKALSVGAFPSGQIGTVASFAITVTATDADGNTIVGRYENPVTLSDSDVSGATIIATYGADHPPSKELLSSIDVATLTYTGASIASATIGASATGAASGHATFAPAPPGPLTVTVTCNVAADACTNGSTSTAGTVQFSAIGHTVTLTPQETPASTYTLESDTCNKADDPSAGGNWATLSPGPGISAASYTVTAKSGGTIGNPSSCTAVLSDVAGQTVTIDIGVTVSGIGINAQ